MPSVADYLATITPDEQQKLALIGQYESGFRNVPNYAYGPGVTPQGLFQISDTNWSHIAPGFGIRAPSAMHGSPQEQTAVALSLLRQPNGFENNWLKWNDKLRAAVAAGGGPSGESTGAVRSALASARETFTGAPAEAAMGPTAGMSGDDAAAFGRIFGSGSRKLPSEPPAGTVPGSKPPPKEQPLFGPGGEPLAAPGTTPGVSPAGDVPQSLRGFAQNWVGPGVAMEVGGLAGAGLVTAAAGAAGRPELLELIPEAKTLGSIAGATTYDLGRDYYNYWANNAPKPRPTIKNIATDTFLNALGYDIGAALTEAAAGAGEAWRAGKYEFGRAGQVIGNWQTAREAADRKASQDIANLRSATAVDKYQKETGQAQEAAAQTERAADKEAGDRWKKWTDEQTQQANAEAKAKQAGGEEALKQRVEQVTGRTRAQMQEAHAPEWVETEGGATLPGPKMTGRQREFWDNTHGIYANKSKASGINFDNFWADVNDQMVDPGPLGQYLQNNIEYAKHELGLNPDEAYSGPLKTYMGAVKRISTPPDAELMDVNEEEGVARTTSGQIVPFVRDPLELHFSKAEIRSMDMGRRLRWMEHFRKEGMLPEQIIQEATSGVPFQRASLERPRTQPEMVAAEAMRLTSEPQWQGKSFDARTAEAQKRVNALIQRRSRLGISPANFESEVAAEIGRLRTDPQYQGRLIGEIEPVARENVLARREAAAAKPVKAAEPKAPAGRVTRKVKRVVPSELESRLRAQMKEQGMAAKEIDKAINDLYKVGQVPRPAEQEIEQEVKPRRTRQKAALTPEVVPPGPPPAPAQPGLGPSGVPLVPVKQLRGLRTEGVRLVNAETQPRNKAGAQEIVDGIDNTLGEAGILTPEKQWAFDSLRMQHRNFKTIFPNRWLAELGRHEEPLDNAKYVFDSPNRSVGIYQDATPDQKIYYNNLYADMVLKGLEQGKNVVKPEHDAVLAQMFPHSPLGSSRGYNQLVEELTKLDETLIPHTTGTPETAQASVAQGIQNLQRAGRGQEAFDQDTRNRIEFELQQDREKFLEQAYKSYAQEGIAQARTMGDFGRKIISEMDAVRPERVLETNPVTGRQEWRVRSEEEGRAFIAAKYFAGDAPALTPQDMARIGPPSQWHLPPEQRAGMSAVDYATEVLRREQTGREMALSKLQGLRAEAKTPGIPYNRRFRLRYMAYYMGIATALGRQEPLFVAAMGLATMTEAATGAFRRLFLKDLADNPDIRNSFWNWFHNPAAAKNFKNIAWRILERTIQVGVKNAAAGATGWGFTPPPPDETGEAGAAEAPPSGRKPQTPGINTLEKSRSAAIAPISSGADAARRVSSQVAGGKTPDITRDLQRGNLSADELKKILQHNSNNNLSAVIDNVPLPDVMSAAEVATPQEKELLIPLIRRRMQAELQQIPNKTLQMKLTQRFQRLTTRQAA